MRKTKEQKAELAAAHEIAALGWNTHSRSDAEKRAYIGSDLHPIKATAFLPSWISVLKEIRRKGVATGVLP